MSERTHSDVSAAPAAPRSRSRFLPLVIGTAAAAVVAAVAFQIYRAEPGVAQQREAQPTGTAKVAAAPTNEEIVARVNNEPVTQAQVGAGVL